MPLELDRDGQMLFCRELVLCSVVAPVAEDLNGLLSNQNKPKAISFGQVPFKLLNLARRLDAPLSVRRPC